VSSKASQTAAHLQPGQWAGQALSWLAERLSGRAPEETENAAAPRRDVIIGLCAIAVFLFILVGWGSLARLDSGVYAQGSVVVAGNRQAVQNKDGGIVSELDAHEGDRVKAGQILLKLAPEELLASERAASDQVIQQEALQARLLAEINSTETIAWSPRFAALTGEDRASAETAMRIEQREFVSRRADLQTQKAVLGQREKQLADQIDGYHKQISANQREQSLIKDEIDGLAELDRQNLVPITRLRALQRNAAELAGNFGEYNAEIAKTEQQIGEASFQISGLDKQRIADASRDFREAQAQLSEANPKLAAIRDQIARTTVRSPASGRVVGLAIFTVGGVVAPGQKLMDVVPDEAALVIQANIKPNDASDLRAGQSTEIRIPAFRDRRMPLLTGVISKVSADSFVDEKTGAAYFRAEVVVPASELRVIRDIRGAAAGLRPGLPVEVVVPLRNRTAIDYLTEPLRRMFWRSFREQ
jgi:HlyD family secretion protein